eukprot:TRINITY_DN31601_c0_g1_i1.p1 TRINITY_DN31601_c0_g1~~TRINITY_DN31601_c0_g1_i1.p1  ORF type:complete len:104 (-),score=6.06 TRINITY_DN31601_c0_g1_i1:33-308(-)
MCIRDSYLSRSLRSVGQSESRHPLQCSSALRYASCSEILDNRFNLRRKPRLKFVTHQGRLSLMAHLTFDHVYYVSHKLQSDIQPVLSLIHI